MTWIKRKIYDQSIKRPKKILCIGNSFSVDTFYYVHDICQSASVDSIIGVAHMSGGDLEEHWNKLQNNEGITAYRKWSTDKGFEDTPNYLLKDIIVDEDWDIIIFQQVSTGSGNYNSFQPYLNNLAEYVKENSTNDNLTLGLNMTWPYSKSSTNRFTAQGFSNQTEMYNGIVGAYREAIKSNDFSIIIPTGTAIQNARNNNELSVIGNDLTSDGAHLDEGYGRFIAALTASKTLFGIDLIGEVVFKPVDNDLYLTYSSKLVSNYACLSPFEVTIK